MSYAHESHADHTATSHGAGSSIAGCLTGLWLNAARQRATSHGSDSNTGGNHKKGKRKMKLYSQERAETTGPHRSGSFLLVSTTLRSLLSAYTKPRAELLTGGGKAALAQLLVCGRWQLIGRMRRLIFSSVSRFTSCYSGAQ